MVNNDRIKLAFAYGASIALQEVGFDKVAAEQIAVDLVHEAVKTAAGVPELTSAAGSLMRKAPLKERAGAYGKDVLETFRDLFKSTKGEPYRKAVQTDRLRAMLGLGAIGGAGAGVGGSALVNALRSED